MSRRERRREAAKRYQSSGGGQLKHAARTSRWRRRRRSLRQQHASCHTDKVTHQGCLDALADASLLACDTPSACESPIDADSAHDTTPASTDAAAFAALVCRRCAHPLLPHVRQGWLRTNSVRWRGSHDHPS